MRAATSVVPTVQSIPKAPTDLKVTPYGSSAAYLSWVNPPGQVINDEVCYGTYPVIYATTAACNAEGFVDKTLVTGLTAATQYYFTVYAQNTTGNGLSAADLPLYSMTLPPAPTNLTVRDLTSTLTTWQVNLSWADPSGYLITGGNIYAQQTGFDGLPAVKGFSGNMTHYTFTGLTSGSDYFFAVSVTSVVGTSPISASVSLFNTTPTITGLKATYEDHYNIGLHWNPVAGGTAYTIWYGTMTTTASLYPVDGYYSASGFWIEKVDTTNASGYILNGLTSATTYFIVVEEGASGNAFNGPYSTMIEVSTTGATAPVLPSPPSALKITSYKSTSVSLSWTDGTGAYWTEIMYTSTYPYTVLPTVLNLSATSSTTITGLTANTTYWFWVGDQVNGNAATSLWTNMVTQVTAFSLTATNLKVVSFGSTNANLTWTLPTTNTSTGPVVSQVLLIYPGGVATTAAPTYTDSLSATATSYDATGLTANTLYDFMIMENGYLATENYLQTSTSVYQQMAYPQTPGNLTVTGHTYDSVTLSYTNAPGLLGSVGTLTDSVDYGTGTGASSAYPYSIVAPGDPGAQTVTITAHIVANTSYYFCIQSTNFVSQVFSGAPCSASVALEGNYSAAPTDLHIASFTATSVSLAWTLTPTTNIFQTEVWYGTTPYVSTGESSYAGAATAATITGLATNTTYYFWVTAEDALNAEYVLSPASNEVSQETSLPVVPTSLHVVSGTSTTVTLGWTDPTQPVGAGPVTSIQVWTGTSLGNTTWGSWSNPSSLPGTATTVTETITAGAFTYWAVAPVNYLGDGAFSSMIELNGSTLVAQTLAPPTALHITSAGINWLNMSWTRSGGAAGYTIDISSSYTPSSETTNCEAWNLTYCNDTAVNGLDSLFYLYAQSWDMAGGSSLLSAGLVNYMALPITPTGLAVTAYTNWTTNLSWNPSGTATEGYTVLSSTATYGGYVNPAVTPWSHMDYRGPTARTTNYFILAAENPLGYSLFSGTVWSPNYQASSSPSFSPLTGPIPALLAAQEVGTTYANLSWLQTPNATSVELIYGLSCSALTSNKNGTGPENLNITGLTNGTTYCFEASANSSAYSKPLNVTTLQTAYPGAPYGLVVTGRTSSSVELGWVSPVGSLTNATIWYGSTCSTLNHPVTMGTATTRGMVSGLAPSTTYCFAVQVWNRLLGSPLSAPHLGSTLGPDGGGGGGVRTCLTACGLGPLMVSGYEVLFLAFLFIIGVVLTLGFLIPPRSGSGRRVGS
ncbi:MAG: fibronectin type III domain-containing protein [Acidimicrobiales bacterium]